MRTDDKRVARIDLLKSILASVEYDGKDERCLVPNGEVAFAYAGSGALAP